MAELWVVDIPRRELRHFILEDGQYRRLEVGVDGVAEVTTVEGFRLRVGWLFQGPDFPSSLEVVTRLLKDGDLPE